MTIVDTDAYAATGGCLPPADVDGVTSVDGDLASGAVVVTSDTDLDRDDVREAVEEAGYVLSD